MLSGAAAVELIHTYSLIHDDLPALDDDDLRRGRPTLHRQFDEATAILAGDALLTLGLTVLAERPAASPGRAPGARREPGRGRRSAPAGMIGGQVEDLEAERCLARRRRSRRSTGSIAGKTGALLVAVLGLGGLYARCRSGARSDSARLR